MAKSSGTVVRIEFNKFPAIAKAMPGAAIEIIGETLEEIEKTVQLGLAAGGTGRQYGNHRASAPGASPATDLGTLAASLQPQLDKSRYQGSYGTNVEYGPHLEYGTVKMAARPFLTPAAEKARPGIMSKVKKLESRIT